MFIAAQLLDSLGDLDLTIGRLGHPHLVDGEGDQCCAMGFGNRDDPVELLPPGLEIDRVDDCAARDLLERRLDHGGFG